jgi:NAD(P)-dependent dehydrogenase (short-subunit alcohol dehydrogenase family)
MTQLSHQTALVTGANRGIGREFARQLLDRGAARVYAAARDPARSPSSIPAWSRSGSMSRTPTPWTAPPRSRRT